MGLEKGYTTRREFLDHIRRDWKSAHSIRSGIYDYVELDYSKVKGLTAGSVIYASATGYLTEDNSKFFWDATNKRLGINMNAPLTRVHIQDAVCGDYAGLHPNTYLLIEGATSAGIQIQSSTAGLGYIAFADDNYNPAEGLLRYIHASNKLEIIVAAGISPKTTTFDGNGITTNSGYIQVDSTATAQFIADSHDADAYLEFQEDNVLKWTMGFDYSDSLKFKISEGVPGTNTAIEIQPTTLFFDLMPATGQFRFMGGTGEKGLLYKDTGGTARWMMLVASGTNVVEILNQASNGTVEIHANTSTAGAAGDVHCATFEDDLISFLLDVGIKTQKELRFYDNGNYVGFEAPALSADQIWVLPSADGPANEVLGTDNSGNLIWRTHDELAGFESGEHFTMLDEDDMASNSDTQCATQQSVKAYVDTAVAGASLYAFKTITGITNDVVADATGDTLTLASANNRLTIVGTAATDTVTFTLVEGNIDHGSIAGLADDDHSQYILHSLAGAANDFIVASGANTYVKKTLAETGAILEGDIQHDNLQGITANEHIDHSGVSISAGTGLTGGGDITSTRTLSLSHLGFESLSDPNADKIPVWDDSADAFAWLALADEFAIDATPTLTVDHDKCTNFDANEHFTQANITTVGTIGAGTWQGSSIAVTYTDAKCTDATADNTAANETSHADVVQDGDFTSNGILKRTGAGTYGIVTDASANWNTAYGWGDHAAGGYAPASHAMSTHSDEDTYNINTSGTLTAGNATLGTIECNTITVANGSSINLQESIAFTGGTMENIISFPDNLASALGFKEGGNFYLQFCSVDGGESVVINKRFIAVTNSVIADLTFATSSITCSSGAISFGNENLSTTGTLNVATNTLSVGQVAGKIGIGTANPYSLMHIYEGSSGAAGAQGGTYLTIESDEVTNYINFLSDGFQGICFGDSADLDRGYILYYHVDDSITIRTAAATAVTIDNAGAMAVTGCVSDGTCEIMTNENAIEVIDYVLKTGINKKDKHNHERMDMKKIYNKYPFLIHESTNKNGKKEYFDKIGAKGDLLYAAVLQLNEKIITLENGIKELEEK